MSEDKGSSELIKQLHIDQSQRHVASSSSFGTMVFFCLISAAVGAGASYMWLNKDYGSAEKTPIRTIQKSESVSKIAEKPAVSQANDEESSSAVDKSGDKILDASGYVTARRIATVSAKVMGLILDVNVEEGMEVEAGQVLARIEDKAAQVNLRLAKAQVEMQTARIKSLQVELAEARRVLSRLKNLEQAGNFSSESQLSKASSDVDRLIETIVSARADLKVAELQVKARGISVGDHVIRAPYSGVVTTKNAQAGEIVSPSSAGGGFTRTGICTIVDMTSLEIEVDVNEAFIGRVTPGQKVMATLDAYPKWQIPASVIAIIPTADRAKATVRVRIKIEKSDPKILPDMSVKVSFYSGEA